MNGMLDMYSAKVSDVNVGQLTAALGQVSRTEEAPYVFDKEVPQIVVGECSVSAPKQPLDDIRHRTVGMQRHHGC